MSGRTCLCVLQLKRGACRAMPALNAARQMDIDGSELQVQHSQAMMFCDEKNPAWQRHWIKNNCVSAGAAGRQLQGSPTAGLLADRRYRRQKVAANWTDLLM